MVRTIKNLISHDTTVTCFNIDEGDFSAILNQASALASKYQSLGIELGVSQRDLANIKHENPTDIMRLGDVILKWLQGKEKPTWKVLVEAVYRVDPKHAQGVAKQLRGLCIIYM